MPRVAGFAIELLAHPRHQGFTLVAHHVGQGRLAEHPTQRRIEQRRQARIGALDGADRLVEQQRVVDAVAREGVDHEPFLIGRDHFLGGIFEVENPVVHRDHVYR